VENENAGPLDRHEIESRLDIPAIFETPQGRQALRKLEELAEQGVLKRAPGR
jgi:hypothetical protein